MKVAIDVESLTMGDLEDWERATGENANALLARFEAGEVKFTDFTMRELNALVWVFARREDPSLTLDDVRQSRLQDVDFGRPPAGAGARGASGSRRSQGSTRGARRAPSTR